MFLLISTQRKDGGGEAYGVPKIIEYYVQSFKKKILLVSGISLGVIAASEGWLQLSMVGWRVFVLDSIAPNIYKCFSCVSYVNE